MSRESAGPLRDTIALSHVAAPVPDGDGGWDGTPAVYTTERCEVQPASASWVERVVGVQVQAPALRLVRMYYRSDVRLTDVATWTDIRGHTHQLTVRGVQPDPDGRWLWLACEERLPA